MNKKMTVEECLKLFPEGKIIEDDGHKWRGEYNATKCYNLICEDVAPSQEEITLFVDLQTKLSNLKSSMKNMPAALDEKTAAIYIDRIIEKQEKVFDELHSFINDCKKRHAFPDYIDFDGARFFLPMWHSKECARAN